MFSSETFRKNFQPKRLRRYSHNMVKYSPQKFPWMKNISLEGMDSSASKILMMLTELLPRLRTKIKLSELGINQNNLASKRRLSTIFLSRTFQLIATSRRSDNFLNLLEMFHPSSKAHLSPTQPKSSILFVSWIPKTRT